MCGTVDLVCMQKLDAIEEHYDRHPVQCIIYLDGNSTNGKVYGFDWFIILCEGLDVSLL